MIWWTGRVAIGLRHQPLRPRSNHRPTDAAASVSRVLALSRESAPRADAALVVPSAEI